MLTLADLTSQTVAKIKACSWNRIIEKHEGPETWASTLKYDTPDFLEISGRAVLLPLSRERHRNVTILRCIPSEDGNSLYSDGPDDEMFCARYMAVCDRPAGEDFFITVLYHEWFIIRPLA